MATSERHETIRSLAHELWLARGKPIATPEIDWAEAERLINARSTTENENEVLSSSLTRSAAGSDAPFSDDRDGMSDLTLGSDEDTQINPDTSRRPSSIRSRKQR